MGRYSPLLRFSLLAVVSIVIYIVSVSMSTVPDMECSSTLMVESGGDSAGDE